MYIYIYTEYKYIHIIIFCVYIDMSTAGMVGRSQESPESTRIQIIYRTSRGDISLMYLSCSNCERNIGQFLGWLEYPAQISLCLQKRMLYTSRHPIKQTETHSKSKFLWVPNKVLHRLHKGLVLFPCFRWLWVIKIVNSKWLWVKTLSP